jgi:hypothetical protein
MNAFGHVELTSGETRDGLEFRVDREAGWFPLAVLLVICAGFLAFAFSAGPPAVRSGFAAAAMGLLLWIGFMAARTWGKISTTTLSVTRDRLVASGGGLKSPDFGSSTLTVPVGEIKSIGYESGGEDDPCGLYAACGVFKHRCLLPGLNRQQATAVAIAIVRRFPQIASNAK